MPAPRAASPTGTTHRGRPYYTHGEIERICVDALRGVSLYPAVPEPIRIERFIEKRFGVSPKYEDLGEGILGLTMFGRRGVQDVIVSQRLDDENTPVSERRIRTTLAHEAGHGLLHEHMFLQEASGLLVGEATPTGPKVLCRDEPDAGGQAGYRGQWWEYQANRAIGSLLLPRGLVALALDEFMVPAGGLGLADVDRSRRTEAARRLSETFDVNGVVARLRFDELYPGDTRAQGLL